MKAAYIRVTSALELNPENVREYFALEELYLEIPACELASELLAFVSSNRSTVRKHQILRALLAQSNCRS